MRSDNHSLFALTNKLVPGRRWLALVAGNVEFDIGTWTVLCDFSIARDSKLDWSK